MRRPYASRQLIVLAVGLALTSFLGSGVPSVAQSAKEQLSFGVKMAKRGLWNEALFRFKQASRLDPENSRILNNLAVASEATGRFDEALDYYKKALALNPTDRNIKENYSRFVEFYQSYRRPEAEAENASAPEESAGDDEAKQEADPSAG